MLLLTDASEVVQSRLKKVFSDTAMFKNIVLWNWSSEGSLQLDVFLTPNRSTVINSMDLLKEAVENFEEFLVFVFGKCWERCTEDFCRKFKQDKRMLLLTYSYLKHCFVQVCKKMHGVIRQRMSQMVYGAGWVKQFSELLENIDYTYESQMSWQKLENMGRNSEEESNVKSVKGSSPV